MKDFFVTVFGIIVIALAMLIFFVSASDAQQAGLKASSSDQRQGRVEQGGEGYGAGMWNILSRLNLTADQKSGIKSILAEQDSKLQPLVSALKNNREMLRSMSVDGSFNEAEVRAIATRQAAILTELIVARHQVKSRLYALLNVDQRARAEKMLDSQSPANDQLAD